MKTMGVEKKYCCYSSFKCRTLFCIILLVMNIRNSFGFQVVSNIDTKRRVKYTPATNAPCIQPYVLRQSVGALFAKSSRQTPARRHFPSYIMKGIIAFGLYLFSSISASAASTSVNGGGSVILPHTFDLSTIFDYAKYVFIPILAPVVVALFQGGTAILNYKTNFGDAPPPKIPAHGVVVTAFQNKITLINKTAVTAGTNVNSNLHLDDFNKESDFLRLLLIGDSLAVGIGQSSTCTPVMPEAIAKEISKGTGKAVYWTCHGESGASTSWIVRMLQNSTEFQVGEEKYTPPDFENWEGKNRKFHGNYLTNGSDTYTATGIWAEQYQYSLEGDEKNRDGNLLHIWKKRLAAYRKNFDPAAMGPFDIVVLMTGSNDLKTMLLPFAFEDEGKLYKQQSNGKKRDIVDDITLLMQTINEKVERRMLKTIDGFRDTATEVLARISKQSEEIAKTLKVLQSNQSLSEKVERTVGIPLERLQIQTDSISHEINERIQQVLETLSFLASNYTLPETLEHGIRLPLIKVQERSITLKNDIFDVASAAYKNIRSNVEELDHLFALSSDYSQILLQDEFKLTQANATETDAESEADDISKEPPTKEKQLLPIILPSNIEESRSNLDITRPGRPIFVLPGMPARALPAFRKAPLKWFTVGIFDLMDKKKQRLAQNNPNILFVKDPSLYDIIEYEGRTRLMMNDVNEESLLLSLKDIQNEDCNTIEQSMTNYFSKKGNFHCDKNASLTLSELQGIPGTKIFSPDQIHPNDFGYDFWGRHIGKAIAKHLQSN